jgi:hypothetical protein
MYSLIAIECADIKFHLAILKRFDELFDAVEATEQDADAKAKRVQEFLVCAEARYVRYLTLLDEFAMSYSPKKDIRTFGQVMPLPPWY